jgi:hypothetical protein
MKISWTSWNDHSNGFGNRHESTFQNHWRIQIKTCCWRSTFLISFSHSLSLSLSFSHSLSLSFFHSFSISGTLLEFCCSGISQKNKDDVLLVLMMAMKIADLGHTSKKTSLHLEWCQRITEEFYHQVHIHSNSSDFSFQKNDKLHDLLFCCLCELSYTRLFDSGWWRTTS